MDNEINEERIIKKAKVEINSKGFTYFKLGFCATLGVMTACAIISSIIWFITYAILKNYVITLF